MLLEPDGPAMRQHIVATLAPAKTQLRARWVEELLRRGLAARIDRLTLDDICNRLFDQLIDGFSDGPQAARGELTPAMRDLLAGVSSEFGERGLTPAETAQFVLSLKRHLHALFVNTPEALFGLNELLDAMGLFTMEAFILRREQIIRRQTQELIDISVPVVPLWEGILSLPIIGTLDSGRAQAITEKLLFEIARTNSRHALLDISGVPTVDTQTAQYLAKTVAAARLMGAECVVTGIRPAIAQVMVALGINLSTIETRFSLAEGLRYCFTRQGLSVRRAEA
jgi:rsbT co-antagonist protein RsbR